MNDEDELVMAITCLVCGDVREYFDLDQVRRAELIDAVTKQGATT